MDVTDITPQLKQLDVNLDSLETALKPLMGNIGDLSSKLPLLDRAKLFALTAYALESIIFSSLRLNGVEAKNHAVFQELIRVKQYFDKIQKLETPPAERETTLNTEAAIRVVKANLGDDKDIKNKLNELLVKERAKAEAKTAAAVNDKKRSAEQSGADSSGGREPKQHNKRTRTRSKKP
ncbi:Sas10/Utp3/C1D family-domain-containing protein [Echria macrotheca]|uniref:Exosome complex protein n=1 Tax=Echria macrotheca TaxID=438768 RepID=A0AAJ0FEV3_9PEZI|nr:Sas10/Utp3/C1D family-domain-containing protein [Echria macrotheca]